MLRVSNNSAFRSSSFLFYIIAAAILLNLSATSTYAMAEGGQGCFDVSDLSPIKEHFDGLIQADTKILCEDADPAVYRMVSVLHFLLQIKFDQPIMPSGDDLVTAVLVDDWKTFVWENVPAIKFENVKAKTCASGALAYVTLSAVVDPRVMHICPAFLDLTSGHMADAVQGILHETWHLVTKKGHVTCTQEDRKGEVGACDESVQAKGAYAVTVESLARMAVHALNIHPAMRDAARADAMIYALGAFNTIPNIVKKEVPLLLMRNSDAKAAQKSLGMLVRANPKSFKTLSETGLQGPLTNGYDDELYIFGSNHSREFTMLSSSGRLIQESSGREMEKVAATIHALNPLSQSIVGVHLGNPLSALVTEDSLAIYCNSESDASELGEHVRKMSAKQSKFAGIVYPSGFDSSASSITVRNQKDEWADVSCSAQGVGRISKWRASPYGRDIAKVMKIADTTFLLSKRGEFFRQIKDSSGTSTLVNETPENGSVFDVFQQEWIQYFDGE